MSVELSLSTTELNNRIEKLAKPDLGELSLLLAAEGESQTRRRISQEKSSPDGTAWDAWSSAYEQTRHSGHSLLENEGDLVDSIISGVDGIDAIWGSNLVYAAAQNFGYEKNGLPAREFLGLSEENRQYMAEIIDDWLDSFLE